LLLCFLALGGWNEAPGPEYLSKDLTDREAFRDLDAVDLEQAASLLEIVQAAAQDYPDTLWCDARWSQELIASYGGRLFKHESFMMLLPTSAGHGQQGEMPTLVIYLESYTQEQR
jgi:hypothetical protein